MPDNPRVHRRARTLATGSLLLATIAGSSGCLGGFFLLPRFDFGGPSYDPHSWYAAVELDDGARARVGVDTGGKDFRPCITRLAADGKQIWRRSYGRMGEGGHGIFVAATELPDRSLIAVAGDKTLTTLALVSFDLRGPLRWAEELDLPAPAAGRAQLIGADDGAVAWVPVQEKGGPLRLFVVRVDGRGALRWAGSWNLVGEQRAATWSGGAGLTLLTFSSDAKGSSAVLTRAAPSGEPRWMTRISNPPGGWGAPSLATPLDGGLLLAAVGPYCQPCANADLSLARFDDQGQPLWHSVVHRPVPANELREYLAEKRGSWPSPSLLQAIAPGEHDTALVALTVPAPRPGLAELALLELGPRGELIAQRAFTGWAEYPQALVAAHGAFAVTTGKGERCRITPGKPSTCGSGERVSTLASSASPLDVGRLDPFVEPLTPKVRDLREELLRTEDPK